MELFPYEVKPKIYLGQTLKGIRTKKFEQMFSKYLVIKLQRLPFFQPVDVEKDQQEDIIITADEVKPEVDIISSTEVDLSTHTSILQSNSYFLRTRETKRRKYTDIDENDELTLKIYSNYLEKVPVLRIEKLPQELFIQGLQRLEELKQNIDKQSHDEGPLLLEPNGIKQEIDESQAQGYNPQVEKKSLQLKKITDQVQKGINGASRNEYKYNSNSDRSRSGSEFESESDETVKKKMKYKNKKKPSGYVYIRKLVNCHICNRVFDRSTKLAYHLETHKANREKNVLCQVCKKGFYNEYLLSNHMKWAHNKDDEGQEYLCPHCGRIFFKRRQFQDHLKTHLKEYKCEHEHCAQVFKKKMYLRMHQQLHRADRSQIKCEKCSTKFSSKRSLSNHILRKHIDVASMTCPFEGCGKSFRGKFNLENHQKIHQDPSIKCPHCSLMYRSKNALTQHVHIKHRDKLNFSHKCTFDNCSRSFFSSLHLVRHLKEHEDPSKPPKRWLCTQCGKPFKTKEHLATHQISHGSDKNFKCPHDGCEKVFKYPAHSRTHFRIEHEMNDEEREQYFKEVREKRSAKAKTKAKQSKGKETNAENTKA